MRKLVIYDMDKTITRHATYSAFLRHMAAARAPWRLVLAPLSAVLALAYLARLVSRDRLKEYNQALFLGRKNHPDAMAADIERYAQKVIANNCLEQARAQIASDKADGCTIMMATASYELYASKIGEKLGCNTILGTRLEQDDEGNILAKIYGANCYGAAKQVRIMLWLEQNGGKQNWDIVRCYSDHVSDAPMLEMAQQPYAINPHPPLKALAQRKGWRIAQWR